MVVRDTLLYLNSAKWLLLSILTGACFLCLAGEHECLQIASFMHVERFLLVCSACYVCLKYLCSSGFQRHDCSAMVMVEKAFNSNSMFAGA